MQGRTTMNEEVIQLMAYIKQTDNEIKGMLKDREMVRQKLIQILPGAEQIVQEMELTPVEEKTIGGQDGNKPRII
jgi:hypothetical protein